MDDILKGQSNCPHCDWRIPGEGGYRDFGAFSIMHHLKNAHASTWDTYLYSLGEHLEVKGLGKGSLVLLGITNLAFLVAGYILGIR